MRTIAFNKWDGGMTNDPRDPAEDVAQITKNLDNYTDAHRITPHPDIDFNPATDPNSNTDFDSFRIQQFIYSNSTFWGLGVQSGTTKPAIYTKSGISSAWALGSTTGDYSTLGNLGVGPTVFTLYQDNLYGLSDTNTGWWKFGTLSEGAPTWTKNVNTGTFNQVPPPVVHSKDDIMYFAWGSGTLNINNIGTLNVSTWNNTALTFPVNSKIASICEYNNFLAIAVNNPNDTCAVWLWDRDSELTNIPEKIDWGSGTIQWIQNVGGSLVGCSIPATSALAVTPRVVFKHYDGIRAVLFREFVTSASLISNFTQKFNNLVYFLGEMTINGTILRGVWKVVKHSTGQLTVSFDRLPRLDDTVVSGTLYGFLRAGDYFHIATQNVQDSNKYIVTKTLSTFTGTTCFYETTINPEQPERYRASAGARSELKQLMAINLMTQPLTASQGVILSYRVDGGAWIQIFNQTTIGTVATERILDTNGSGFTAGREYEFQIKPVAGAVVTELRYKYETLETLL